MRSYLKSSLQSKDGKDGEVKKQPEVPGDSRLGKVVFK